MKTTDFKKAISLFLATAVLVVAFPASAAVQPEILLPDLDVTLFSENISYLSDAQSAANEKGIPSSYSAVDAGVVTAPKDQQQNGTCWTFAAASMAETSLLATGGTFGGGKLATLDNLNFSEAQIAYFTYGKAYDPLGNLNGDGTAYLGENILDAGGNHYFTTLSFAAWQGICEESVMPYDELTPDSTYDIQLSYAAAARLENAMWLNMSDTADVKSLIMKYGSVLTDYAHYDVFFNEATGAYYCPDFYSTNHAITIVGWDDDYSKANFNQAPAHDGAWLVKNSWGEDWGNDGYFWISYEDGAIVNGEATCMLFVDAEKYDNNYQYDGSCVIAGIPLPSGMLVANTYTASASEKERIEAVSFALLSENVNYSIQIFKDCKNYKYMNGEPLLSQPVTGTTSYMGYYTVELPEEVVVSRGEDYTVCIEFSSNDGSSVNVLVDYSGIDAYGMFEFTNDLEGNKSHYGQYFSLSPSGMYFSDLVQTNGCTARIKAFTTNVDENEGTDTPETETEAPEISTPAIPGTSVPETSEPGTTVPTPDTSAPDTTEPDVPEYDCGDINGDGKVNMLDIFRIKLIIAQKLTPNKEELMAADVNGDGLVNGIDSFYLKFRIAKGYWIN